jgi:hypothetical protein
MMGQAIGYPETETVDAGKDKFYGFLGLKP